METLRLFLGPSFDVGKAGDQKGDRGPKVPNPFEQTVQLWDDPFQENEENHSWEANFSKELYPWVVHPALCRHFVDQVKHQRFQHLRADVVEGTAVLKVTQAILHGGL